MERIRLLNIAAKGKTSPNISIEGNKFGSIKIAAGSNAALNVSDIPSTKENPIKITSESSDAKLESGSQPTKLQGSFAEVKSNALVELFNAVINTFIPDGNDSDIKKATTNMDGTAVNATDNVSSINTLDTKQSTKSITTLTVSVKIERVVTNTVTTVNLGSDADITSLETSSTSLNISLSQSSKTAKIGSIDVINSSREVTITVAKEVTVSQVAVVDPTGNPDNVTATQDGNKLPVQKKPETPDGVGHEMPLKKGELAKLTKTTADMSYKVANSTDPWKSCSADYTEVPDGQTYWIIRLKTGDYTVDSNIFTVTIPKVVPVSSAAISGSPIVGQTLTAVANSDANGTTFTYEWSAVYRVNGDTKETPLTPSTEDKSKLTLTDDQVGRTIKVSITSNYNDAGDKATSNETNIVTADMAEFNKVLKEAITLQNQYVKYTSSTNEIPSGVACASPTVMGNLESAITTANSFKDNKSAQTTGGVTNAISALQNAINEFKAKAESGTMSDVSSIKTKLTELVSEARSYAKQQGASALDNGLDVKPDSTWVASDQKDSLETVCKEADTLANKSGASVSELSAMITKLRNELAKFKNCIQKGATIDTSDLTKTVADARANLNSVYVVGAKPADVTSDMFVDNANKVLPTDLYVTAEVWSNYNSAIETAAYKVNEDTQAKALKAISDLNGTDEDEQKADGRTTKSFNAAKKPGEKDMVPPTLKLSGTPVRGNDGATAEIKFTSDKAGTYSVNVTSAANFMIERAATGPDVTISVSSGLAEAADITLPEKTEVTITLTDLSPNKDYAVSITPKNEKNYEGKALVVSLKGEVSETPLAQVSLDSNEADKTKQPLTAKLIASGKEVTGAAYQWYEHQIGSDTPASVLKTEGAATVQLNDGWKPVDNKDASNDGKHATYKVSIMDDTLAADTSQTKYYGCVITYGGNNYSAINSVTVRGTLAKAITIKVSYTDVTNGTYIVYDDTDSVQLSVTATGFTNPVLTCTSKNDSKTYEMSGDTYTITADTIASKFDYSDTLTFKVQGDDSSSATVTITRANVTFTDGDNKQLESAELTGYAIDKDTKTTYLVYKVAPESAGDVELTPKLESSASGATFKWYKGAVDATDAQNKKITFATVADTNTPSPKTVTVKAKEDQFLKCTCTVDGETVSRIIWIDTSKIQ